MGKFDPSKMKHFTPEETAELLRAWANGAVSYPIKGPFEEITVGRTLVNPHLTAGLN